MKRFLPVLLGALAGAVGLLISMYISAEVARILLPWPIGRWPTNNLFGSLTVSIAGHTSLLFDGRIIPISGFVLGAMSVVLWRGERTLWPRFGSGTCSVFVNAFLAWTLMETYRIFGAPARSFFWELLAFYLPIILWSSALFFFAILARKRTTKPLLP